MAKLLWGKTKRAPLKRKSHRYIRLEYEEVANHISKLTHLERLICGEQTHAYSKVK